MRIRCCAVSDDDVCGRVNGTWPARDTRALERQRSNQVASWTTHVDRCVDAQSHTRRVAGTISGIS